MTADADRSSEDYAAVPYLLVLESVQRDGVWIRRAEHPELPGCAAEAPSAIEAIRLLDHERRRVLDDLSARGVPIPVPRPPLRRSGPAAPTSDAACAWTGIP